MCRPFVGIAVVVVTTLASIGCETDGNWTVNKILGWDDPKAPKIQKYPLPNTEVAMRVENLGHRIIAQNTFTGNRAPIHHDWHSGISALPQGPGTDVYQRGPGQAL